MRRRFLEVGRTGNPDEAMHCVYAFFNAVAETTRPGAFRSARANV
jgi:hypothetical protein